MKTILILGALATLAAVPAYGQHIAQQHVETGSKGTALELEKHTRAVEHGRLVENIGIETLGGVFTPFLSRGQAVPCEVTETFGTAADNQDRIQVRLFRGTRKLVKESTLIGRFAIEGLPKKPRGIVSVAVTFSVTSEGDIIVGAHEQSGQPLRVVRDDR
jgi:molecular chaperone DnaK